MGFNDPRGSIWRKWDLHAHTPLDHEWINRPVLDTEDRKKDFAKKYVEKALSENLEVVAITDHNFCKKFDELLIPYIQEEASQQGLTIFPGFELTLREGSGVHVLVIFPEDTELSYINEIVTKLLPAGDRFDSEMRPIMSDCGLYETVKVLEKFKAGNKITNYLIVFAHADNDNGVLDGSTVKGEARVRLWNDKNVKVCQLKKSPELYNDGFIKNVVNCLDSNYQRPDMAYIIASDCRSLEPTSKAGRRYLGEKFTWIKADPTFEGLLHAIANPKERIYIGEQPPLLKRLEESPSKFIKKLAVKAVGDYDFSKGDWFKEVQIPFNPGMVAIIGHKGNGKSALADIIALCGNSHIKESHFSFLNEKRFKKPPENIAQFFEARIYWWDEDESQSESFILLSETSDRTFPERVKYIPQHYFEVLTADLEGQEDFEREIKNMIFQHIPEEERYELEDFDQLERFLSKAYIEEIEPIKRAIEKLNEQIVSLEAKKIPEHIIQIKEKKAEIEKEIKNLDNILEEKIKQEKELRSFLENSESKLSQINKLEEERRKYESLFKKFLHIEGKGL